MKIIAESAFNHNGDMAYLKALALESKKSGADYFTIQVMVVDSFCVKEYSKYTLYKESEFSISQWVDFFGYCLIENIKLIPCVLEEKSFELCFNHGFKLIKLHATDITNEPLLSNIANKEDLRVILETQCATMFEINFAIEILGEQKIEAIFTGFSNYPTEVEDLNLNIIDTLRTNFNFKVGYADHSLDTIQIPLMILAKGCDYLEKHITMSRNNRNLDYQVSLYPNEFSCMVSIIKHYSLALGNANKHPTINEKKFRNIMYKKVIEGELYMKRSDTGKSIIDYKIDKFEKSNVTVALIARLKSQRLKQKVMLQFHNEEMILDLYKRISKSEKYKVYLATSNLSEDEPLFNLFNNKNLNCFKGDAISVIDRMLNLAYSNKSAYIFRVTGDNPFTDPKLMDEMLTLMQENDLDYVRVNGVPFGVAPELFSLKYLWKLYLELNETTFSEYLTWYVLNDNSVKMGSIDVGFKNDISLVNLSIDTIEDFERCVNLLNLIKKEKFEDITLFDILNNLGLIERVDDNKEIKLPNKHSIKLKEYLSQFYSKKSFIRKKYELK